MASRVRLVWNCATASDHPPVQLGQSMKSKKTKGSFVKPVGAVRPSNGCPSIRLLDWQLFAGACLAIGDFGAVSRRSEEHTSELQSLMRISYAVFCLKKKINIQVD